MDNPARPLPLGFLAVIALGTGLLMLPISRTDPGGDAFMPALFTAVSAICVTGLITVDTPTFWTPFGQVVIMMLIQVGGFGIMTLSTLLALVVRKRLSIRTQLAAASETHTLNYGDVRRVLTKVAQIMFTVEAVVAVILSVRFWVAYDHHLGLAAWHGTFHAVSAFNNAGFSTFSDSLMSFVDDPWIIIPICAAFLIGGIGFPVITEFLRGTGHRLRWGGFTLQRPPRHSTHYLLTLWGSAVLLVGGFLALGAMEWNRPETLGDLPLGGKLLGALGLAAFPRTAGFNSIDYGSAAPETLLLTEILMFIGGGSAGTAGGIKLATFLVLAFAIWTEVRGHDQLVVGPRAISSSVQRQALSVALAGVAAVVVGSVAVLLLSDEPLETVLFECVSAFATVGLSTGITADLPTGAQLVLIALMFMGRVGSITIATSLALRPTRLLYRLPEERPIIG